MKNQQTIDIVVPNYNKARFIGECLLSLKQQTFTQWRCIVVDGFSDDGSWEIIQNISNQDARFELYQVSRTSSFYQAWNFGLSKVRNPYFCVLTSDDIWPKNWLQLAIQSLTENKDAVCAAARTRVIDSSSQYGEVATYNLIGEKFFGFNKSTSQLRAGIVDSIANHLLGPIYTSIHSLAMRSEILSRGERFSEDLGVVADRQWYVKIGLYGNIIYHPKIEVGWRVYEGQATNPKKQQEVGRMVRKIHQRNQELIAERLGCFGEEFKLISEQYDRYVLAYHYGRPCLANIKSNPIIEIFRLLQISFAMPRQTTMDLLLKFFGKSFYVEESISIARQLVNSYKKISSDEDNQ